MTPTLMPHDAIGNDLRGMAQSLSRAGFEATNYAERVHPSLKGIAQELDTGRDSFWEDPGALLIYHHSCGWIAGQDVLEKAKCRIAIKHHNVTPPRFFAPYSRDYWMGCVAGEYATSEVARTAGALFWPDSQFNAEDLVRRGAPAGRCRVLPPFHQTEEFAFAPVSFEVIRSVKERRGTRILFVGGMKPNKGHARLIQALAAYIRDVDPQAILLLPGTSDPRLTAYLEDLRRIAAHFGVTANILFVGPVDDSRLRSYYLAADVFLCLSEHEGFCVPLLEAMYFRVPVVAHRCSAIPETLGEAGLLWDPSQLAEIVESIAVCAGRDERARAIAAAGWERYHALYSAARIEQRFLALVEEAFAQ